MPLETDKSNGFKLKLREELASGAWPSNFSTRVPLWEDVSNVEYTEQGVRKVMGWEELADTGDTEPVRGLVQVLDGGNRVIYAGNLSNLFRIDEGVITTVGSGYNGTEDAGSTIWDSGTTTWDGGSTVWDDGVILATHWSMVSFGTWILATNGADAPQIRKDNVEFNDMPNGVTRISIDSAGTGYLVGESITFSGGGGGGAAAEISAVGGSGEITEITITDSGSSYTTPPTLGVSTAGGVGAVLTAYITIMDVNTIEIFVKRGPHVLGFNTDTESREFVWCSADDVDQWVADVDNTAGQLLIRELSTPIRCAVPLADRIAVYGDDQMFVVNYVGAPNIFGYQPVLNGIGAVSKKAVVPVGRRNFGLSQQGFFVTDGAVFEYIDEPQVRKFFQENVNTGQISKTVAYHDEQNNQVRWYYPKNDAVTTAAVIYNYLTGVWSMVDVGRSAADERRTYNNAIVGTEDGKVLFENKTNNDQDLAYAAYARTKPMDLGDADRVKELDSLRVAWDGQGLQYRVGWSDTEDGSISWGPYSDAPTGYTFTNIRTAGRWVSVEFYSDALNANWEITSADIIGRAEGTR